MLRHPLVVDEPHSVVLPVVASSEVEEAPWHTARAQLAKAPCEASKDFKRPFNSLSKKLNSTQRIEYFFFFFF